MPPIVSPQPLAAAFSPCDPPIRSPSFRMPSGASSPSPRGLSTPIRLLSPVHITETPHRLPPLIPKSVRNTPSRRRSKPASRRRRHLSPFDSPSHHIFDKLPWISALDSSPDHINPWDIADLSQLPVGEPILPISGPGPVRRRKSSLRSNPVASGPDCCRADQSWTAVSPRPTRETSSRLPSTPRSRFNPSRVFFHDLMPVLCDSHNDESPDCNYTLFDFER